MAALIPFTTFDKAIDAIASIDTLHLHLAGVEGDTKFDTSDEYYLAPFKIVTLKTKTNKNKNVFGIIFAGYKVRQPHHDAVKKMGANANLLHLYSCEQEIEGILKVNTKLRKFAFEGGIDINDDLYERTVEACAKLLDTDVPKDWQKQRQTIVDKLKQNVQVVEKKVDVEKKTVAFPVCTSDNPKSCNGGCGFFGGPTGFCSQCKPKRQKIDEKPQLAHDEKSV